MYICAFLSYRPIAHLCIPILPGQMHICAFLIFTDIKVYLYIYVDFYVIIYYYYYYALGSLYISFY